MEDFRSRLVKVTRLSVFVSWCLSKLGFYLPLTLGVRVPGFLKRHISKGWLPGP